MLPATGYWILRSRQAANAADGYVAASSREVDMATFEHIYDCSAHLRDAELAVPFSNRRNILIRYLNRIAQLEERAKNPRKAWRDSRGALPYAVSMTRILVLIGEREALEAELGVMADPAGADTRDIRAKRFGNDDEDGDD